MTSEHNNLREANVARQAIWCPDQLPDLSFRGVELAGETGEVCNVIKKLERERLGWRGSRDTVDHLAEELADVVICADLCAIAAGIDLEAAVESKFNATSEKVGLPTRYRRAAPDPSSADLGVLEAALDRIETLAFDMPPPNVYTPRIVQEVLAARTAALAALATREAQAADPAPVSEHELVFPKPPSRVIGKIVRMDAAPVSEAVERAAASIASMVDEWYHKPTGANPPAIPASIIEKRLRRFVSAPIAEAVVLRAALEKAATRFEHCAQMIASGTNVRGTLRAEQSLKAQHYALEARAALNAGRQP